MDYRKIENALKALKEGKIILVTDDEDRENEGDLICSAEAATTENVNFMATEGKLVSENIKVGIVAARFNEFITSKLVSGALDGLKRENVQEDDIDVAWVPGAFEIPLIASKMAKSRKYDAIICVGAVIRGSTSHYDYVCNEVSKGIAQVSLANDIPVMFGVLTTDTIEQAIERAGTKAGNKGFECAQGAIEMVNLIRSFE